MLTRSLLCSALLLLPVACADDAAQDVTLLDATQEDGGEGDTASDTRLPDALEADSSEADTREADVDASDTDDTTTASDTSGADTSAQDTAADTRAQDTSTQDTTAQDTAPLDTADPCEGIRDRVATDAPPANASWRYGGGTGYPDRVIFDPACMTGVSTKAELISALGAATAGDIVYVHDDATIDLTGESLCIPGGVWLAGGRGQGGAPGGLILTRESVKKPILKPCGDDVRITGLRILGDDAGECPPEYAADACTQPDRTGGVNCRDCTPASIGIQSRGYDRLEVDGCELAGWSYAAIWLTDSVDNHVHHNHIHHTQRQGLGYGVVLTRGGDGLVDVLIDFNRFDYNRHAVAGSGEPGQDYIARDNLVLEHSIGHVFDMHGEDEGTDNGSEWAGGDMRIHRNTVLVPDRYALVVRGKPQHGSWLYDNCLARSGASSAALQRFFTGNFYVDRDPSGASRPNRYSQSAGSCETLRWCYAPGGDGPWSHRTASSSSLTNLRLADLDGDGETDVFTANGTKWRWVSSGTGGWQDRNTSTYGLSGMRFGDFDGDGRDDVFIATGSEWRVSDGGSSGWRRLRAATEQVDALGFGDFDGDGKTDVFTTTGSEWRWSKSGTAPWARLNTSSYDIANMAFGDFDGDGKTDVFSVSGGAWRISSGGSGRWTPINSSGVGLSGMRFGDFDGDGTTDVLSSGRDVLRVSWGGSSPWQTLRISDTPVSELAIGDFNGDGRDDLFRTGCL